MAGEGEVSVVFFAKSRELVGQSVAKLVVTTGQPIHLNTVKTLLKTTFPPLEKLGDAFILARNEEYIDSDASVMFAVGDELAVIPPISGG